MNIEDGYLALSRDLFNHFKAEELDSSSQSQSPDNMRIILFAGAGASCAAGLPLGQALKEQLFSALTRGNAALLSASGVQSECRAFINRQYTGRPLKDAVHDSSFSLLQFCEALSAYVEVRDRLRKEITARLSTPDNFPVLTYELLAHFLNHRFIDHIVSLNFDALLDDSLRDELGDDGVDIIVSDRDIPASSWDDIDRKPRCLKPHGSILVPDSMRFTLSQVAGISNTMGDLIRAVIFGPAYDQQESLKRRTRNKPAPTPSKRQEVILLFMGWACNEQEFRRILKAGRHDIKRVYWLYPKGLDKYMRPLIHNLEKMLRDSDLTGEFCTRANVRETGTKGAGEWHGRSTARSRSLRSCARSKSS